MINTNHSATLDQEKFTQYMAALVAAISPAMMRAIEMSNARQAQAGEKALLHTGTAQNLAREEGKSDVQPDSNHDKVAEYHEETLEDGRVIKRYEDGTVRVENPRTGVIQEERRDGRLLVSLPGGRLLFQSFPGEPLLVYNLNAGHPPILAQVGLAALPGRETTAMVYTFQDPEGSHVVDVEALRYFRVKGKSEPI